MRLFMFFVIAATLFAGNAYAHVTANPNTGEAGQYFETKFRISHGCEGSDTLEVHLTLPKGTVIAKPQHKSGWSIETKTSRLEAPVSLGHGKTTSEQIDMIIWRGNVLPDSQYDEFGLITKLPDVATEATLWLPVKQVCQKGMVEWKNIPAEGVSWEDTDHPAPFIKITPAVAPKHQH